MIEQETIEKPVEEKSMAALAEILRERGVRVLQDLEPDDVYKYRTFTFLCEDEFEAADIADTAIKNGYPLLSLDRHWPYRFTTRLLPYWRMRFSTSS